MRGAEPLPFWIPPEEEDALLLALFVELSFSAGLLAFVSEAVLLAFGFVSVFLEELVVFFLLMALKCRGLPGAGNHLESRRNLVKVMPSSRLLLSWGLLLGLLLPACQPPESSPSPTHPPPSNPAQRIVSLAPSLTAWVEELGAGERLVGVSEWCRPAAQDEPPQVVGRIDTPNLELIVALQPDLILATTMTPERQLERLRDLGLRVERHDHESLSGVFASLDQLGQDLGKHELTTQHRQQLEHQLQPEPGSLPKHRTAVMLDLDPAYAAGPGAFPYELVQRLGLPQITDGMSNPWPKLGNEAIIELNPELVILSVGPGRGTKEEITAQWERIRQTPAWRHTQAAKQNRFLIVENNGLTVPGPQLSAVIHELRTKLEQLNP